MYVPLIIEKVRMRGAQDLFLVTHIDWNGKKAHLVSLKSTKDVAIDVPFADILPVGPMENMPESRFD